MAKCPKCGRKLHLYDWRPECPDCHVNMIYYKANERLLADSEKAEIEHAKSQPSIDRAKAAFFGSPLAIARIVISLLPIGGLFLPLCKLLGAGGAKNVSVIDIATFIMDNDIGGIFGKAFSGDMISLAIAGLLISVVMILVCVICLFMSLGKHGKLRNFILNSVMLLGAVVSAVAVALSGSGISAINPEYTSASLNFGAFVYIALVLVIMIYNLILAKKGLPIKHTQCLIGGLPSEEYFALKEQGVSELEIRKKMVVELTKMQNAVREKEAIAEQEAMKKAMERK